MNALVMDKKQVVASPDATITFLRGQLDTFSELAEQAGSGEERAGILAMRSATREHLCALLLSKDEVFLESIQCFIERLSSDEEPTGLVNSVGMRSLLGV